MAPIYHFSVADGHDLPDQVGHELADKETAKREAVMLAANLLRQFGEQFWQERNWRLRVTDDAGNLLFAILVAGIEAVDNGKNAVRSGDR